MRRVITRLLSIIPSIAIAVSIGKPGINALLVISQVILSIVLPFVAVPLLYCTSNKAIMSVQRTRTSEMIDASVTPASPDSEVQDASMVERAEVNEDRVVDYSNNKFVIAFAVLSWLIIVAANLFVIVELGLGGQT